MAKKIVANWKMNGSVNDLDPFVACIPRFLDCDVIWCPSFPLLPLAFQKIQGTSIKLGAQNCSEEREGAYTGEVSPCLLKSIGCSHVILGHFERRSRYFETQELLQKKVAQALKAYLIPIVCVSSIDEVIDDPRLLIAYEPSWAIGSGTSLSKQELKDIVAAFKAKYPSIPFLYGGSINESNAKDLMPLCDGLLVGGASLVPKKFGEILMQNQTL